MSKIKVISHQRSGTHLLMETIKLNFDVKVEFFSHKLYPLKSDECIYIVRDVRDVLVSCYSHCLNDTGYKWNKMYRDYYKNYNVSFSKYIHGEFQNMSKKLIYKDPIGHWVRHTEWWDHIDWKVKYENLVYNPEKTINKISKFIGKPRKNKNYVILKKIVGLGGYKGVSGSWKEFWSASDINFLKKRAGYRLDELGYD